MTISESRRGTRTGWRAESLELLSRFDDESFDRISRMLEDPSRGSDGVATTRLALGAGRMTVEALPDVDEVAGVSRFTTTGSLWRPALAASRVRGDPLVDGAERPADAEVRDSRDATDTRRTVDGAVDEERAALGALNRDPRPDRSASLVRLDAELAPVDRRATGLRPERDDSRSRGSAWTAAASTMQSTQMNRAPSLRVNRIGLAFRK